MAPVLAVVVRAVSNSTSCKRSGADISSNSGIDDAVFVVREGGTLKNAIIGKNQKEGVHCDGHCTLEFVWFEDVCEDAISIVSPPPCLLYCYLGLTVSRKTTRLARSPGSSAVVLTTLRTRSSSTMAAVLSTSSTSTPRTTAKSTDLAAT